MRRRKRGVPAQERILYDVLRLRVFAEHAVRMPYQEGPMRFERS
jgi:hypothetical protein